MTRIEIVSVGKGGDVPLPPSICEAVGIGTGSVVTLEASNGAIVIRPVTAMSEEYTPERRAEFLLSNATDATDYEMACEEVRKMGLDPAGISHHRPDGA